MFIRNVQNKKVLLSYIINKEKKVIQVFPGETIEIDDSVYFLSKKAFNFEWLEIIKNTAKTPDKIPISEEDKMKIAKKMMEEYINN